MATVHDADDRRLVLVKGAAERVLELCPSLTRPVWRVRLLSNRWIIGGVTIQALGQATITYVPAMNSLFGTAPIGIGAWGRLLLVAAGGSLVAAIDKRVRRLLAARSA